MEAIMLGIIIVLLCTSLYFSYKYFSLKRQSSLNNEEIDATKDVSANQVRDQFQLFAKSVNEKAENLTEHGEYAAEKADIVRAAIDEVGKGLKKQLVATEESATSIEDMTEAIEELSINLNVNYVTRSTNINAKAGNYNNALKFSNSPYIAFFDADMCPTPDFLELTLPFFIENENKKIGFIQLPQAFKNPDIYQYRFHLENTIPFDQEYFYNCLHSAMPI